MDKLKKFCKEYQVEILFATGVIVTAGVWAVYGYNLGKATNAKLTVNAYTGDSCIDIVNSLGAISHVPLPGSFWDFADQLTELAKYAPVPE